MLRVGKGGACDETCPRLISKTWTGLTKSQAYQFPIPPANNQELALDSEKWRPLHRLPSRDGGSSGA